MVRHTKHVHSEISAVCLVASLFLGAVSDLFLSEGLEEISTDVIVVTVSTVTIGEKNKGRFHCLLQQNNKTSFLCSFFTFQ